MKIIKFLKTLILAKHPQYSTQQGVKMKAWQLHSYGDIHELQLTNTRIPLLTNPSDLLIKVNATSVNPIDVYMTKGYGQTILNCLRDHDIEFPLTLGRDFSGTIIDKGHSVSDKFKIGDQVCGVIPVHKQGSHAEQVIANESHIFHQPIHLTPIEATSILYAAMTAWSALYVTGALSLQSPQHLKILILGASGGVGTVAVQMLKSQNAIVMGTCSNDAVSLVQSLGADDVFDYTATNFQDSVAAKGKYNIILDCAQFGHENIPSIWKYSHYITLNSPLMVNTDKYGLFRGLFTSFCDLFNANIKRFPNGQSVRWGFFNPAETGVEFINNLLIQKKITPIIHQVFKFEELPKAYEALNQGHLRGKIVIDLSS